MKGQRTDRDSGLCAHPCWYRKRIRTRSAGQLRTRRIEQGRDGRDGRDQQACDRRREGLGHNRS